MYYNEVLILMHNKFTQCNLRLKYAHTFQTKPDIFNS